MPLIINGETVDNQFIIDEMEKMRPDFEKIFNDLPEEERELQLQDWAKENVAERILIQRYAKADPRPIKKSDIDAAVQKLIDEHGSQEAFENAVKKVGQNIEQVRKNLELELRIERLLDDLKGDMRSFNDDDAKKYYDDNVEAFQMPDGNLFDDVKGEIITKLEDDERNRAMEIFVDSLKEKADITFTVDDDFQARIDALNIARIPAHYKKPLNSILVKPAGPDCNMTCTYCFYLQKDKLFSEEPVHRMSHETLDLLIRQAMAQSRGQINFGWQGGEPTLMGLEFFQKAVAFQQQYGKGQTIGNGLQTNGLLIDDAWVKFLKEYRFLVGLSLDGPAHIHDHYRHLQGGQPTWEKVSQKGRMMLDGDVAVNALSVVNDYSVQFPEEIYDFHKSFGFSFMQFIPCVEPDSNDPSKLASFSVGAEEYGRFLTALFDLWLNDFKDGEPTTSIRFFDSVFYSYVGMTAPECTLLNECGIYTVIEHNGDVYACDFFVTPDWKLGNIHEDRLIDLLNSPKQQVFGEQKLRLPDDCTDCRWLIQCRGGCPKDKNGSPTSNRQNHLCQSYQIFFEHADADLKRLAETWQQNQNRTQQQHAIRDAVKGGKLQVKRNDICPCGSGKKFKACCGMA